MRSPVKMNNVSITKTKSSFRLVIYQAHTFAKISILSPQENIEAEQFETASTSN